MPLCFASPPFSPPHFTPLHFTFHFVHLTSRHFTPLHFASSFLYITSHHFTPLHTTLHPILFESLHLTSCHFALPPFPHLTSRHFTSRFVRLTSPTSRHFATSCHFMPPPVIFASLHATSLRLPFCLPHFMPLHLLHFTYLLFASLCLISTHLICPPILLTSLFLQRFRYSKDSTLVNL